MALTVNDVVQAGIRLHEQGHRSFTCRQLYEVLGHHHTVRHVRLLLSSAVDGKHIHKVSRFGPYYVMLPSCEGARQQMTLELATTKAWEIMWAYWKACNKRYPVGAFPMRIKDLVDEDYEVVHKVTVAIMEGRA